MLARSPPPHSNILSFFLVLSFILLPKIDSRN
jgi:hypothetical protein